MTLCVCSAQRQKEHSGLWSVREGFPVEGATELGRGGVPRRKDSERDSSWNKAEQILPQCLSPAYARVLAWKQPVAKGSFLPALRAAPHLAQQVLVVLNVFFYLTRLSS